MMTKRFEEKENEVLISSSIFFLTKIKNVLKEVYICLIVRTNSSIIYWFEEPPNVIHAQSIIKEELQYGIGVGFFFSFRLD